MFIFDNILNKVIFCFLFVSLSVLQKLFCFVLSFLLVQFVWHWTIAIFYVWVNIPDLTSFCSHCCTYSLHTSGSLLLVGVFELCYSTRYNKLAVQVIYIYNCDIITLLKIDNLFVGLFPPTLNLFLFPQSKMRTDSNNFELWELVVMPTK